MIKDLHAETEGKEILKGFNLEIKPGETHAIMGPNGAGKSTLAKILAGHPFYEVTQGEILLNGESILELEPEERVALGLFMSFQYPLEITGVSNKTFLKESKNKLLTALEQQTLSDDEFDEILSTSLEKLSISKECLERDINVGFSGGEKKRNEILQMLLLDPKLAVLDETDSGLDIDAMKAVSQGVNLWREQGQKSLILITHYQRLLDYIKPDFVHVMIDGKIVQSGDASLAVKLEEQGYEWLHEKSSLCCEV